MPVTSRPIISNKITASCEPTDGESIGSHVSDVAVKAPGRRRGAGEWLPELEILTAFHGAVIGFLCCFAATLSSDGLLTLLSGTGATLCTAVWVHKLE